jgi:hypothetical protein
MAEGIASMSDLLLQVVAIRLAALLLASLVLRALPEQPSTPSSAPPMSLQRQVAMPHPDRADPVDLAWRDMRLHD